MTTVPDFEDIGFVPDEPEYAVHEPCDADAEEYERLFDELYGDEYDAICEMFGPWCEAMEELYRRFQVDYGYDLWDWVTR